MIGFGAIGEFSVAGDSYSGTICMPGSDVSVVGWTFNSSSVSASVNELNRDDTSYAQALYGVSGAITTLIDGNGNPATLAAGAYVLPFAAEYLVGAATSGQFRFSLLDGSNASQGVSSWQAVTSSVLVYRVPITTTGVATRLKIEIQA
jgi:hypothetical protein